MKNIKKNHSFEVSKEYNFENAENANKYLEVILSAERRLSKGVVETEDGIYWKDELQEEPDLSLYSGATGILYLYTKLYNILKDEKYRTVAEKSAEYISKHWRDFELSKLLEEIDGGYDAFLLRFGCSACCTD